jgi:hypothetical protein
MPIQELRPVLQCTGCVFPLLDKTYSIDAKYGPYSASNFPTILYYVLLDKLRDMVVY